MSKVMIDRTTEFDRPVKAVRITKLRQRINEWRVELNELYVRYFRENSSLTYAQAAANLGMYESQFYRIMKANNALRKQTTEPQV